MSLLLKSEKNRLSVVGYQPASSDGGGATAKCIVHVYEKTTSITLSKSAITIYVGDSYQLTATVKPDGAKQIMWGNSNTTIANVKDGFPSGL